MSTNSYRLIGLLKGADLNTTADQVIPILDTSKYRFALVFAYNASTNMSASSAAGGIYTAASKGGTALLGATQNYTGLSSASAFSALGTGVPSIVSTAQTLYFSLTTPHGSAATCDLAIWGYALP